MHRYCFTNNILSLNQIRSSHCFDFEYPEKKHAIRSRKVAARFSSSPTAFVRSRSFDSFKMIFVFSFARPFEQWHRCIIIRFRLLIKCTAARFFPRCLSIVVLVTCNQARDHTIFLHGRQFIIFNSCYCFHSNCRGKYAPFDRFSFCQAANGAKTKTINTAPNI